MRGLVLRGLAVVILSLAGQTAGLLAHLSAQTPRCHRLRAWAPVSSAQVDEASASAAEIDEEWFPAGADEETLKKHFRKLAAREHPDVSTAPDAEERFLTLTTEYTRLMDACKTGAARLELAQVWAGLGGVYFAVSVAFNDPSLSALLTTALGSIKLAIDASNGEGFGCAVTPTASAITARLLREWEVGCREAGAGGLRT